MTEANTEVRLFLGGALFGARSRPRRLQVLSDLYTSTIGAIFIFFIRVEVGTYPDGGKMKTKKLESFPKS